MPPEDHIIPGTTTAPTPDPVPHPANTPANTDPSTILTTEPSADTPQAPADTTPISSILDDGSKPEPTTKPSVDTSPEDDAYAKFSDALEDFEVGETFDKQKRVFPKDQMQLFVKGLKAAGISAEVAPKVLQTLTSYEKVRLEAENKRDIAAINSMAADTQERFGDEFPRAKENAQKALKMMDGQLFRQLLATPSLVNYYPFVKFLADIGERIGNDTGIGAAQSAPAKQEGFNISRLLPKSGR